MAMELVRTGVSGGVGVVSGVLSPPTIAPLVIGTTSIEWGLVAEALAVVGGGALQLMSPFTIPNVADGLVDGGIALLANRGTKWAVAQMRPAAAMGQGVNAAALGGGRAWGQVSALGSARGQVGVSTSRKRVLT